MEGSLFIIGLNPDHLIKGFHFQTNKVVYFFNCLNAKKDQKE